MSLKTFSEFKKMLPLKGTTKQYELQLSCEGDCNLVGPRADGKTTEVVAYLLWKALTTPNINIGISSATASGARDVLERLKHLMKESKMLDLLKINRKTSIEFFNGTRILTEPVTGSSYRGYNINTLYIDEINLVDRVRLAEFMDCILPVMQARKDTKIITSSYRGW
jgi:hypothetical protein